MNSEITFGQWLRQQRLARDLTQEELADRIGCSIESIRKIEADRRRPSRQTVELLEDHFGVPSDEREDLLREVLAEQLRVPPEEHEDLFRMARLGDHNER